MSSAPAPVRPASVGMPLRDVETPALLIDLDALEFNLDRMALFTKQAGVALRPHAKSHKCPALALMQIAAGAVGVCCQKVSEAEAMVAGGVRNVFVSNEIVSDSKLDRLAELARSAHVAVCVDDPANIVALGKAAQRHAANLDVLIEIDVGSNRCGVRNTDTVPEMARLISRTAGLNFSGLQAYFGTAQHMRSFDERRQAIDRAVSRCREVSALLSRHDFQCRTITGGGTGTFPLEAASGIYTEVQPGSYLFMDADYKRNRCADGSAFTEFRNSLFVWTTIMSHAAPAVAVVDAGIKAVSTDSGMPEIPGLAGAEYSRPADEHGTLHLKPDTPRVKPGDKLMLIPGHCDPTVNLHEWFVGIRHNQVESVWPITARGPGF